LSDFADLSANAAAHALSRLAADGALQRLRKGLYFRPRATVLGPSMPSATAALAQTFHAPLHPSGLTAASASGLTTQNPGHGEYATPAAAGPGALRNATPSARRLR
jgi:predicted transcriptional regulator of viral defense system